jgi:hypothetical protein
MDRSDSYREAKKCPRLDGNDSPWWIHDLILRYTLPWYEFSYFHLLFFGNFISDVRFSILLGPNYMLQWSKNVNQFSEIFRQSRSTINSSAPNKNVYSSIFGHVQPTPISFCADWIIPGEFKKEIEKLFMNRQEKVIWHCIKITSEISSL